MLRGHGSSLPSRCLTLLSTVSTRFSDQTILQLRKAMLKGRKRSARDSYRLYLNPSDLDAKGQWPKTWGKASVGRPRSWTPPAHPECARGPRRLSVSGLPWEGRCGWTGLWTGSLWSLGCCICEFLGRFSLFLERKEREHKNPSPFAVFCWKTGPSWRAWAPSSSLGFSFGCWAFRDEIVTVSWASRLQT